MKITSKEISLITDAIVDQIYNEADVNKKIKEAEEKARNEFSKSKQWKDTLKLLKLGKEIDGFEGISVKDFDFFHLNKMCGSCSYKITNEERAKQSFMGRVHSTVIKDFPDRFLIRRKVETLLTIKTLCGKDMEAIMSEIIATVKKEFKL